MVPAVSFTDRLADGWRRSADALWLAFVPVVTALLSVDKLAAVVSADGFHVGVSLFALPSPAENVWQFVSTPSANLHLGIGASLAVVAVGFLVTTPLLGGYLGSVRRLLDARQAEFDFVGDAVRYLPQMAVWTGLPAAVTAVAVLVTGGFGTVNGGSGYLPVVFVLFVASVVSGYLFYAAPFLVVLRDVGMVEALRTSYEFAVSGGAYAAYAGGYLLFALVVSVPSTLVVVNVGVVGLLVGVPAGARLGLALTTATMRFVADFDDRSPTLRRWDAASDGATQSDPPR